MRKDNKRKNSILALFMSFAIAISGLGVPGISYVSAADEGNRSPVEKAVETPALEKASGMTNKEKVTNAEGKKMSASEEKEAWSVGDNPDHLKGPEKASPYPVILDSKADPYLGKEGKKGRADPHRLCVHPDKEP